MNNFFRLTFLVTIFTFCPSLFALPSTPVNDEGLTKELNLRSFYKVSEQLLTVASIEIKDPIFDEQQRAILFGSRYSLSDNFRLGLFLGYFQNRRHHNNWVKKNGVWLWNNAENKRDYDIAPEVSYRNLINNLVYEIKIKYVFSTEFNEQNTFAKLNLVYNFSPAWTLILSDEVKISFSNKERTLQENWIYFSPFYKLNNYIQLGPIIGYFNRFWTRSEVHKNLRTDTYLANESSVSVGLNMNFYGN